MNSSSTHRVSEQVKLSPTEIDIDAMLRDMARSDGYDARMMNSHRLLRFDSAPCETPDEVEVTYEREPVAADAVFSAGVVCVCIIAAGLLVLAVCLL